MDASPLHDACVEPLADEARQHPISNPLANHCLNVPVVQLVEKLPYVELNHPPSAGPIAIAPW